MILVCGATGALGGAVARRLIESGADVRAGVRRPASLPPDLADGLADVAGIDFRAPESMPAAVAGADVVVSGVTAIAGLLAGRESGDAFDAVDRSGHIALVEAAVAARVRRFVFVSMARAETMSDTAIGRAKLAVEWRLEHAELESCVIRPEAFQEIWLTPDSQMDWKRGRLIIFGRGDARMPYVSRDDVAQAVAHTALADRPARRLEFGGPEALTRNEVADLIERTAGAPMRRRHVPRAALWAASRGLARFRPGVATLMGLALAMDREDSPLDDRRLRELGIRPRPAGEFVRASVNGD